MTILEAIILGLVEGVTEFLPVSSTGHLVIASSLLGLDHPATKQSMDAFNIMIQGGAILAVAGLYWKRVVQMVRGVLGRDAAGLRLFINITIAFLPAAVIGIVIEAWIERHLFHPWPVIAALFLGGVALVLMRRWQQSFFREAGDSQPPSTAEEHDRAARPEHHATAHAPPDHPSAAPPPQPPPPRAFINIEHLTPGRALIIGLLQVLAMWPGTSRSMMTILGGMLVGLRPKDAAEFSFLLGLPTLGGACLYKSYKTFFVNESSVFDDFGVAPVIIGALAAMLSAAIAVKWLVSFLSRHGVTAFGWYRIALAALLAALILTGLVTVR
jgi:undecaprenyl-diphosphatase